MNKLIKNLEKNWLVAIAIVAFVVRYLKIFKVEYMGDYGYTSLHLFRQTVRQGYGNLIDNIGTLNFFNVVIILIIILSLGYYVYWNYKDLKILFNKFLKSIEKK